MVSCAYDGFGRRISKTVDNSPGLDCVYHYYYDGQSVIETRDGSSNVLKQQVWGLTYIDELVQIAVNDDPSDQYEQDCESLYWVCQDANYNVLGVVDSGGSLKERYEYTPYGQRMVYFSDSVRDADCYSYLYRSQRVTADSATQAYGLCEFGHQGLMHDEETGLIYNRARMLHPILGRFMQRDPNGTMLEPLGLAWKPFAVDQRSSPKFTMGHVPALQYTDGMNLYVDVRSNPVVWTDPWGLLSNGCCGPSVDRLLNTVRADFRAQFLALAPSQGVYILASLTNLNNAGQAWEIFELPVGLAYSPTCGTGRGPCPASVNVAGKCWPQGPVNYWLAGSILSLRNDIALHPRYSLWDKSWALTFLDEFEVAMQIYVDARDLMGGNASGGLENWQKRAWMSAGKAGSFTGTLSSPSPYQHCGPCYETAKQLQWHVGDNGAWDLSGIAR